MARKRQKQPLVGWAERSEAHAGGAASDADGLCYAQPILRFIHAYACKHPAITGSGSARTGPPQVLDIAITDRGDAVCGEPFVDRAAGKQRVFAGAPAGML